LLFLFVRIVCLCAMRVRAPQMRTKFRALHLHIVCMHHLFFTHYMIIHCLLNHGACLI